MDSNLEILLKKYDKVAVWGMTTIIMDLFSRSVMLKSPNIYPIDISDSKQAMDLFGKKIYPPSVLRDENITVVVVALSSHAGQITCQAKENQPNIQEIVDVCQLADFKSIY